MNSLPQLSFAFEIGNELASLNLLSAPRALASFSDKRYSPTLNANLTEFVEANRSDDRVHVLGALPESLIAGKNTYVYDAHTYHTKVPPQAIARLIEHYTQPGDLVLDPFCGSGMTGVAALQTQRKPILSDLSPAATFVAVNFLTPVNSQIYFRAVEDVLGAAQADELSLYGTHCRRCRKLVPMEYMVWSYGLRCEFCQNEFVLWDVARDEREDVRDSKILREFDCPQCGKHLQKRKLQRTKLYPVQVGYRCCDSAQRESQAVPDEYDLNVIHATASVNASARLGHPKTKLPFGVNTRQAIAHGLDTIEALYTPRNLHAVAWLWDVARRWPEADLSLKLMFTVTSLYQRVTRLSEFRFWGGSGNIANYNVPMIFNEQNVYKVFRRKAKTIRDYLATWTEKPDTPFCISTQSATDLRTIPDNSIDYIFTDPPFGSNINYSEMNFLWEAWLGVFTDTQHEAIVNQAQGKTIDAYRELMAAAFSEMYRVLKPERWLTLEFHNSSAEVWSALQTALLSSGFSVAQTQTLDKRHGTFKQFVSENAVGYDLILHCAKRTPGQFLQQLWSRRPRSVTAIYEFLGRTLGQNPDDFVVRYLHVKRNDELDSRKLYSLWLKEQMETGQLVNVDYEEFRAIVMQVVQAKPAYSTASVND
jgi:DNA modification methylase